MRYDLHLALRASLWASLGLLSCRDLGLKSPMHQEKGQAHPCMHCLLLLPQRSVRSAVLVCASMGHGEPACVRSAASQSKASPSRIKGAAR